MTMPILRTSSEGIASCVSESLLAVLQRTRGTGATISGATSSPDLAESAVATRVGLPGVAHPGKGGRNPRNRDWYP